MVMKGQFLLSSLPSLDVTGSFSNLPDVSYAGERADHERTTVGDFEGGHRFDRIAGNTRSGGGWIGKSLVVFYFI